MPCRGMLYALTPAEAATIRGFAGDDAELIQAANCLYSTKRASEGFQAALDKAWWAIHLCMTNGDGSSGTGFTPQSMCIMGAENLHQDDGYIICLVAAEDVPDVARELDEVTEELMAAQYDLFVPKEFDAAWHAQDCKYTWSYFNAAREVYRRAAAAGRCVLFKVDQ
jgi:hypothetical protein